MPAVKSVGGRLYKQVLPEKREVETKLKTPKQAPKAVIWSTLKEKTRGGARKRIITREKKPERNRLQILSKTKSLPNVLAVGASHNSLDSFERLRFMITFDTTVEKKLVPSSLR